MNDHGEPLFLWSGTVPDNPTLRERLRSRTSRLVRQYRHQRLRRWMALAASVLLLVGTGWWLGAPNTEPAMSIGPTMAAWTPAPSLPPMTPQTLEWLAFDAPQPQAPLLLEAGQRYLEEQADFEAALRCYRGALPATTTLTDLSTDDNWLVLAIKLDRASRP